MYILVILIQLGNPNAFNFQVIDYADTLQVCDQLLQSYAVENPDTALACGWIE